MQYFFKTEFIMEKINFHGYSIELALISDKKEVSEKIIATWKPLYT